VQKRAYPCVLTTHIRFHALAALNILCQLQAVTRLELQLADMALTQGKALILALNKSDAVPGGAAAAKELQDQVAELLEDRFLPAGRPPVVLLSAQQNKGTDKLLDAVVDAYSKWNKK
jgi:GTP-binding protein